MRWRIQIQNSRFLGPNHRALVDRRQPAILPVFDTEHRESRGIREHKKAGETRIAGTQCKRQPRSKSRPTGQLTTGVEGVDRFSVIVDTRMHRTDHAEIIRDRSEKGGIGFSAEVKSKDDRKTTGEMLHQVEPEDLIKYGLIPEFVGRLPVVAVLDELHEDQLVQILTEPRNALTKQYGKLFEMEGCALEFREDALRAVARKAVERKTGARGLRSILEANLLDTMYDLPSFKNVSKVVVDEAAINGESKPLVIYEGAEMPKAAAD